MKKLLSLFLILTVLVSTSTVFAFGEEGEADYDWSSLKIGAEGFVSSLLFHPTEPGLLYCRTDVGGAYRWDAAKNEWIQLCDSFTESSYFGVDGFAIDPQDPNVLYMTVGKSAYAPGEVVKSTDRGNTWTFTGFNRGFGGNEGTKAVGENIAVDPGNSKIVYVGSLKNGLFKSEDGAQSWMPVDSLPFNGKAVRHVQFDKRTIVDGKTQTIYIGVRGEGIFRSNDAGVTFEKIEGAPLTYKRMELGPSGALYVCSEGQGFLKYDNGTWTNLSPGGYTTHVFNGVSIDPNNENVIMVLGPHSSKDNNNNNVPIWRTEDGGQTWVNLYKKSTKFSAQPWKSDEGVVSGAGTANGHDIKMNPFNNKEVWTSDWAGPHRCKDVLAPTPKILWEFMFYGIEEVVPRTGIALPEGKYRFIGAIADIDGLPFDNILEFPTRQLRVDRAEVYNHPWLMSSADMDYCNEDYKIMLRVGIDWNAHGKMEYSTDGSETWTVINNTPYYVNSLGQKTTKIPFGRCAVSSQINPETGKAVFIVIPCYRPDNDQKQLPPGTNTVPLVSFDYGETWEEVKGLPPGTNITNDYWQKYYPICSDTVKGNYFYMLFGEKVYVSDDWGRNWKQTFSRGGDPNTGVIKAPFDRPGEVWFSMTGGAGVWRSKDYGQTFEMLPGPTDVLGFTFGKEAPGSEYPTFYYFGKLSGDRGVWRSTDWGTSYIKLNNDQHQLGNTTTGAMIADRRTFGVVYVGSDGRGYYLGMPAGTREILEKEAAGGESKVRVGDPELYYNNNLELFIDRPSEIDGTYFVPVREFLKKIGVNDLTWDGATDSLVIKRKEMDVALLGVDAAGVVNQREIRIALDSSIMTSNGQVIEMAKPTFLQTDKMYVPLESLVKALGATMTYDPLQKVYRVSDNALITY